MRVHTFLAAILVGLRFYSAVCATAEAEDGGLVAGRRRRLVFNVESATDADRHLRKGRGAHIDFFTDEKIDLERLLYYGSVAPQRKKPTKSKSALAVIIADRSNPKRCTVLACLFERL